MNRQRWQRWRFWGCVALLALTGCENLLRPHGLPRDPLFVSRRPMEGKLSKGTPAAVALVEPTPPSAPFEIANRPSFARSTAPELSDRVVLSSQRDPEPILERTPRPPRNAPGILTNRAFPRELVLPDPNER